MKTHSPIAFTGPPLLLLALVAGCDGTDPAAATQPSLAGAISVRNGRELNGRELNGRELNGRELNGRNLNGVALAGIRLGGVALDGAWLEGSAIQGADADGDELAPSQLVGAALTGFVDDGTTLALRIDGVRKSPPPDRDVYLYAVSYRTNAGRRPLCGVDAHGRPVEAIALGGRWDYREGVAGGGAHIDDPQVITFACQGYTLAKCVELGYKPWIELRHCRRGGPCRTVSLAGHHQACTRLLRADYCGDGSSFTVDGTLINLYDGVHIQRDTEAWHLEAEWREDGACCLSGERLAGAAVPLCGFSIARSGCGLPAHFASGTLLMSEYR
ncbi:MAG: pentapeptide repeat-containing protein [Myxococcales bacterium]|nr:pentapeptide repeat-containing protein [Myxococcales bacterium]